MHSPQAWGCGKGDVTQAKVGALFEALEHFLTSPARLDTQDLLWHSGRDLATGPLAGDATAPLLSTTGCLLPCRPYHPTDGSVTGGHDRPISGQVQPRPIPLFLFSPGYLDDPTLRRAVGDECNYSSLSRYSSNSGTAIGITSGEAFLHALNETIERDALSLLLARTLLSPSGACRPTMIDPASLPIGLAAVHNHAQQLTGLPVYLLDITTDLGIPAFLAYTAPTPSLPTAGEPVPHFRDVTQPGEH